MRMDSVWKIGPVSTPSFSWGEIRQGRVHECPYCRISLLTGEKPGFCCGDKGSCLGDVAPLPVLPSEFDIFLNDPNTYPLNPVYST
ncbi:hypothetical protein JB92DRAFT_3230919 [Gautieria morchelliformis]|nr:hypothetical protein JB92DRAFT_3230919 [Gautieria morchelliformis]